MLFMSEAKASNLSWPHYKCLNRIVCNLCYMLLSDAIVEAFIKNVLFFVSQDVAKV